MIRLIISIVINSRMYSITKIFVMMMMMMMMVVVSIDTPALIQSVNWSQAIVVHNIAPPSLLFRPFVDG